jgi:hypothetical protein
MNTLQFSVSKRQCDQPDKVAAYGTLTGFM